MARIINDQNYQSILEEGLPLVIDFSATWCGPCQKLAPTIDELATEYEGRVNVCKCDVDESEELSGQFGIRNVPTVIFLKGGEMVDRVVGANLKKVYVEKIEALI